MKIYKINQCIYIYMIINSLSIIVLFNSPQVLFYFEYIYTNVWVFVIFIS